MSESGKYGYHPGPAKGLAALVSGSGSPKNSFRKSIMNRRNMLIDARSSDLLPTA